MLDVDGQVAAVRRALGKDIGAHEEVGLTNPKGHPVDGQAATDHQRYFVVHGSEGGRLPLASRKALVDDHGPGDGSGQPLEDVGLVFLSLVPEHGDEGGGGQRLTRMEHVELQPLRAAPGHVGALWVHLDHADVLGWSTERRLRRRLCHRPWVAAALAEELLDGIELAGQQARSVCRERSGGSARDAVGPLPGERPSSMSSSMSAMEPPRSTTRVSSVQVGLSAAISDELMLRLSEGTVPTANRSVTGPDERGDFLRILQDNLESVNWWHQSPDAARRSSSVYSRRCVSRFRSRR